MSPTPAAAAVPIQPPLTRPESPTQAQTWDKVASRYRAAGWCDQCAAQAAWGHQCGFTQIHPPCPTCRGRALPDQHDAPRARRWAGS